MNILKHAREQGSYYISISQLFANKTFFSMTRKKGEVQQMASLKLVVYYTWLELLKCPNNLKTSLNSILIHRFKNAEFISLYKPSLSIMAYIHNNLSEKGQPGILMAINDN